MIKTPTDFFFLGGGVTEGMARINPWQSQPILHHACCHLFWGEIFNIHLIDSFLSPEKVSSGDVNINNMNIWFYFFAP